jgi:lipid A 3-O-deacylase
MKLESIFFFSLLLLLPLTAMAQDKTAKDFNTFTLYVENDMLHRTDSLYTSGLKLSWISPDLMDYRENSRLPEWSYPLIKRLPLVNKPGLQYSVSMSLGQNIYTPEDTESDDLVKDDRPYAGILYYAIGFHSKSSRQMDSLEFLLGMVGPHSYAEETQEKVHELSNNNILNG